MPETVADPPSPCCSLLLWGSQIEKSQSLGPDPSVGPERDARGRFAKGSSGNRRGRPRGIPNPKRRVPDLVARPVSPETLLALLDRKPHLLRPLVEQLWPPPLTAPDPAARLGIDLSSLRSVEDSRQLLPIVLTGIARGEITSAEGERVAWGVSIRLRAARRLERLGRRLARPLATR